MTYLDKDGQYSRVLEGFDSVRKTIQDHGILSVPTLLLETEFKQSHTLGHMSFHDVLVNNGELGVIRELANSERWEEALDGLDKLESSVRDSWR